MVVGTKGVFGDFVMLAVADLLFGIIVVKYCDDALGAFHEQTWVVAFFLVARQVAHLALAPFFEPLLHMSRLFFQCRSMGDATGIEAHPFGCFNNPFGSHQNGENDTPTVSGWNVGPS